MSDVPYFECSPKAWSEYTTAMTPKGKQVLANMLAHHCLLCRKDTAGWMITRFDLIQEGKPFWHVHNDGTLTYNYKPGTHA